MNHKKYYSGWGNYPVKHGKLIEVSSSEDLSNLIQKENSFIPVGNFRSYGDSALSETMVQFTPKKTIEIDSSKKTAIVSADILIGDLIDKSLPIGLFPPVVPGTKFVTIGGAIAADIHGKNHHIDGCFSDHVIWFKLMKHDGKIVKCSKESTSELFALTCGGMGLTGVIISAKIKMKQVESDLIYQETFSASSLQKLFNLFDDHREKQFSVAWIDCTANGNNLGRGIFMSGEFCKSSKIGRYKSKNKKKISVSFFLPPWLMNPLTIKLFNTFYFYISSLINKSKSIVEYNKFFFPLDNIHHWNRMYGTTGFLQYQFVLPFKNSYEGLKKILGIISDSRQGSPLAVLKLFGPRNKNYLSFPMEGFTLALDFKNQPDLFSLLDELDKIVLDNGGRVYLAKDARIKKKNFESGYAKIKEFRRLRHQEKLGNKFQSYQSKRLGL